MKELIGEDLKKVQLEILKHVDSFCREHSIRYYMSGGSLIGAIRHKGFIPWDDDIDIMMLRSDYEKFIREYSEKDKSEFRIYSSRLDTKFALPYAKVDSSKTVLKENVEHPLAIGVNIDVFPIDIIPQNKEEQKRIFDYFMRQKMLFNLKQVSLNKERSFLKNIFLFFSHLFLKPLPLNTIVSRIEKNAMRYINEESPKYCGVVVWGYGIREVNLLSNYATTLEAPFEDMVVPIPVGYDNYLRGVYGDYMQLPPKEKRISHHNFKAWSI